MTSPVLPASANIIESVAEETPTSLDLSRLPSIFVLSAHLDTDELHTVEDDVTLYRGRLTYDPHEGKIFVGMITQKLRAALELRSLGLQTVEVVTIESGEQESDNDGELPRKRRRVDSPKKYVPLAVSREADEDSSTASEPEQDLDSHRAGMSEPVVALSPGFHEAMSMEEDAIVVVSLSWLKDSISSGQPRSFKGYTIYSGNKVSTSSKDVIQSPISSSTLMSSTQRGISSPISPKRNIGAEILARAEEESATSQPIKYKHKRGHTSQPAKLIRLSTDDIDLDQSLPEMPHWVKSQSTYSCERSTPMTGPNDTFVQELHKIRLARTLTDDQIGVRAYSTSIAAIAAYPYTVTSAREILALPGCDTKIAALWSEWHANDGVIQAAQDTDTDEYLSVLRLFYDIWGVGAHTAREFYNQGLRDLDDVVEYGWEQLTRVQQIGVKFFEEFQQKIQRAEVEAIAAKVHEHAQRVREATGIRSMIVGGYRRGKVESGDVDLIVTHIDESQTLNIVQDIVESLVDAGWITHELSTSLSGSRRGQSTLQFRGGGGGGHGFDTLDKALVVWQDPIWPGMEDAPEGTKNPNVHRRVDIIIAPWSKIGCAVLGWSAGTTFERDLRRYAKRKKGWKFDSSGIRDRMNGLEVDLEGVGGKSKTMEEAEKKVFAGLGLVYREPWDRCTG